MKVKRSSTLLLPSGEVELCIEALKVPTKSRSVERIKTITSYLKILPQFMQVIEAEYTNLSKKYLSFFLKEIANHLAYQSMPKDRLLMHYGQKGSSYFIILSGKVGFLTVKNQNFYLNEEEYILHLIKLRTINEIELLKNCISFNRSIVHVEDDFDLWLQKLISESTSTQSSSNKIRYSPKLLKQVREAIDWCKLNPIDQEEEDHIQVNVAQYIKATSLEDPLLPNQNRFLMTIPVYEHINSFSTGGTFGYFALEQKSLKRTASAITMDNCNFGVLSKEDYHTLLKEVQTKSRQKFLALIYSYYLFNSIPKKSFEMKYFNMFTYEKIERNQKILSETEECKYKFFIQKGQFELIINANLIEVNQLLIKLKKKLKQSTATEEKNIYDLINNKLFRSPEENKLLLEKTTVRVALIKDRDIIGLNDTIDDSNNFGLFTCHSFSYKSEVFQIKKEAFSHILKKEDQVKEENDLFTKDKVQYYIDRLNQHQAMTMNLLKKYNDDNTQESYKIDREKLKVRQINKNRFISFDANIKIKGNKVNCTQANETAEDNDCDRKTKKRIILPSIEIENSYQGNKLSYEKRLQKLMSLQKNPGQRKLNSNSTIKQITSMSLLSSEQIFDKEMKSIITRNKYVNTLSSCLQEDEPNSNPLIHHHKPKVRPPAINTILNDNCSRSKVNYVDCLIMERFNYLYTRVNSPLNTLNSKVNRLSSSHSISTNNNGRVNPHEMIQYNNR